jgi:hypothetical protein
MAMSGHCPSDLADDQWRLIRPLLPKRATRGRPPISRRDVLDAVPYPICTRCQCRQLPLGLPKWKAVYTVFWWWRKTRGPAQKANLKTRSSEMPGLLNVFFLANPSYCTVERNVDYVSHIAVRFRAECGYRSELLGRIGQDWNFVVRGPDEACVGGVQ